MPPEELKKRASRYCSPASSMNPYRMLLGLNEANPRNLPDVLLLVQYLRKHQLLSKESYIRLASQIDIKKLILKSFDRQPPDLPSLLKRLTLADFPKQRKQSRAWYLEDLLEVVPDIQKILEDRGNDNIRQLAVRACQGDTISAVWLKLLSLHNIDLLEELEEATEIVNELHASFQKELMELHASIPKLKSDTANDPKQYNNETFSKEVVDFISNPSPTFNQNEAPPTPQLVVDYKNQHPEEVTSRHMSNLKFLPELIQEKKLVDHILENPESHQAALVTLIYQKLHLQAAQKDGITGLKRELSKLYIDDEKRAAWALYNPSTWQIYTLIKKYCGLTRFEEIKYLATQDIEQAIVEWPDTLRDFVLGWGLRGNFSSGLLREFGSQRHQWQESDFYFLVPELRNLDKKNADLITNDFIRENLKNKKVRCPDHITFLARHGHEKAIFAQFCHHMLIQPLSSLKTLANVTNIPIPEWLKSADDLNHVWTHEKVKTFLKQYWTKADLSLVKKYPSMLNAAREIGLDVDESQLSTSPDQASSHSHP
ncbi:hypothetical protein [Parendozoicomonas sp. Alg238-R29]|uniref:hypothetical protein n=1 Tax=Parendozoicomonas sp. Alg238-R29 TaxID=2993446 RepID=UPI00248E7181|nr:hypothetical protein [Parendozoicomonas sp. Alg238-R29]